jgi:hypothetical protein
MIKALAVISSILLCLLFTACRDSRVSRSAWLGRWEDGTGYWLEISETNGVFFLRRSPGILWHLTLLEYSAEGKRIRYKEDSDYIHTLQMISTNELKDEWFNQSDGKLFDVGRLHKTQDRATWKLKE